MSLRTALEQSFNIPAVKIAQAVGTKRILHLAESLGIRSALADNLSIALGTSGVSLLELTFGVWRLGAWRLDGGPDSRADGDDPRRSSRHHTPVRHQRCRLRGVCDDLAVKKVVERGTAAKAKAMGLRGIVAGKTGTTDGYRDAWFIGYTPDVVGGSGWVSMTRRRWHLTGAQAALPMGGVYAADHAGERP